MIAAHHYTHSLPAGENIFTQFEEAVLIFSRPANMNISRWLVGDDNQVWELSRMWAPDGHRRNLLTQAIASCTVDFLAAARRMSSGECTALISYADPNVGHSGLIYRAASWVYLGQSEEGRYYTGPGGEVMSRRSFHSSSIGKTKSEILSLGYSEDRKPGKHRFARGLTKAAKKKIESRKIKIDLAGGRAIL